MRRSVGLHQEDDVYILSLTPSQFELVRRVLIVTFSLGPPEDNAIHLAVGEGTPRILAWRDQRVDFQSRIDVDVHLSFSELRTIYAALAYSHLGQSSEEAFHNRYGFYSENVKAVAWALLAAFSNIRENE